ncbi:MAG: hypothetical protein PHO29_11415 [Acetobacterium sp.]|nr:hypothetical protein [Acetobacterium sp.]
MRLFFLECRRILKSKTTRVTFLIVLIVTLLLTQMLISGECIYDQDMKPIISGEEAIEKKRAFSTAIEGLLTPEKLTIARKTYMDFVKEYGDTKSIPSDIYREKIMPIRALVFVSTDLMWAYKKDDPYFPETYSAEDVGNYYNIREEVINRNLKASIKDDSISMEKAYALENRVKKPLYFADVTSWSNGVENMGMAMMLVAIASAITASLVFSAEYRTGSDSILRTMKCGPKRLGLMRIVATLAIAILFFLICVGVMGGRFLNAFGADALQASVQIRWPAAIAPLTFGQFIVLCLVVGLLTNIAVSAFALFVSSHIEMPVISVGIVIIMMFLPMIIHNNSESILGNWIRYCLPSSGISMTNSFLYTTISHEPTFLRFGPWSFWAPVMIVVSSLIFIPIMIFLTLRSYTHYESMK